MRALVCARNRAHCNEAAVRDPRRWHTVSHMTTDLQCRCGTVFSIGAAGSRAQVLWLVEAPDVAEGFQKTEVNKAHRLHECPTCRRLVFVSSPGVTETLVRNA
jgi:hypothetical protein